LRRGLTQVQVVAHLAYLDPPYKIGQNTISRLETVPRDAAPSMDLVKALGRVLGVDPLRLQFGPPPAPPKPARRRAPAAKQREARP